jgi:Cytochrome c554 and c-prime
MKYILSTTLKFNNTAFTLIILVMVLTLFLNDQAVAKDKSETQVNSLAGLVKMFDSSSCKECHEKIYEQWEKSHHARPLMGLNDQIFMTGYLKKGPLAVKPGEKATKKNFPCFKCHFPQIEYATDAVAAEIADAVLKDDKATVRKLNIGCLVCHNEKAVVHGRPEKNVIYGNKDIIDHPNTPVKKSPLLKNSLLCGQCHGLGPNLEFDHPVQCATLYGSYLHAYIPSGGTETCQQCHMKDGDHYMPPNFNNRAELSERLREALPMQVRTLAYSFQPKEGDVRPMVVVNTKITSKAGHRIPDG